MRQVIVEFGNQELRVGIDEAREWVAAGLARWLPRRNRMIFMARRDAKPVTRGLSAVVGAGIVEIGEPETRRAFLDSIVGKSRKVLA